jgi:hypothetical protein
VITVFAKIAFVVIVLAFAFALAALLLAVELELLRQECMLFEHLKMPPLILALMISASASHITVGGPLHGFVGRNITQ